MTDINENVLDKNRKIVFFVKQGLDNFINDIIDNLSRNYETKKVIVTDYRNIDGGMEWADIIWFEWCDELLIYGSKLDIAKEKTIICRLHSYEVFSMYPSLVNWDVVDKLVVVAEQIKTLMVKNFQLNNNKVVVIANGINIDKFSFRERTPGFNIAYVGYINYKKGPMLLLQAFKAIYDKDNRYKLYIAGRFQNGRYILYFRQMIIEMGLTNNVIYEGWIDDMNAWLEDKDYIICSSVFESQNLSVMEAMSKGIKPLIHNFVGASKIYKPSYIWNTCDEMIDRINQEYKSKEYRGFIKDNYSFDEKINKIKNLLELKYNNIHSNNEENSAFNYKNYWEKRYAYGYDSGQGSTGFLADFKAGIINNFIKAKEIKTVVEFGCGDGYQLSKINYERYIGLDISQTAINKCKDIFEKDKSKSFFLYAPGSIENIDDNPDLIVCLDVLYHIIDEDDFIKTLDNIFILAPKYVILYTMIEKPMKILDNHIKFRNIFKYLKRYKHYSISNIVKQKYPQFSASDFIVLEK